MGWIVLIAIIVGDVWLYLHGGRQENTIWNDEKFINKYHW